MACISIWKHAYYLSDKMNTQNPARQRSAVSTQLEFTLRGRELEQAARIVSKLASSSRPFLKLSDLARHSHDIQTQKAMKKAAQALTRAQVVLEKGNTGLFYLNKRRSQTIQAFLDVDVPTGKIPYEAFVYSQLRTLQAPKEATVDEIKDVIIGSRNIAEVKTMLNLATEGEAIRTAGIYEYIGIVPMGNLERLLSN